MTSIEINVPMATDCLQASSKPCGDITFKSVVNDDPGVVDSAKISKK